MKGFTWSQTTLGPWVQFGLAHLSMEHVNLVQSVYTCLGQNEGFVREATFPSHKNVSGWFSAGLTLLITGVSWLYHMWKLVCSDPGYLGETRECQVHGVPFVLLCFLITWRAWSSYSWSSFFWWNYIISDTCMLLLANGQRYHCPACFYTLGSTKTWKKDCWGKECPGDL